MTQEKKNLILGNKSVRGGARGGENLFINIVFLRIIIRLLKVLLNSERK